MKRIIIVDDDPGVQEAFRLIFDPQQYAVTILPNGHPLLQQQHAVPDLYILDKQLSGVDGLDICRFLKTQPATRHIPVIMLSASPHIHPQALHAGADDALEKPFSVQALRDMVNKHLHLPGH
jgi:CheY-like chemotaxis protein